MDILENHQDGLAGRQANKLPGQSLQGQILLALRAEVQGWVAAAYRERKKRRQQGGDVPDLVCGPRQEALQLVEFCARRIVWMEASARVSWTIDGRRALFAWNGEHWQRMRMCGRSRTRSRSA